MRKPVALGTFLLFLVLLTFLPRLLSLSAHWASDETLWMLRSREFFFAMQAGKFADTNIAYHPGVTTCWLGSVAIWNRYQRDSVSKNWFYSSEFLSPEMLASIRLPIALVTGILVLVAGFFLYRLFGGVTAGIGTLFLAIEPFLLSESRRAHTDVLMALFLFLSLLLWLYYLESETPRRRILISSGTCFGFACLTKSLAGAFILFLPILLVWYVRQHDVPWVKLVWSALLWMMSTLLTGLVAWPYLWTATSNLWGFPMFPFLFMASGALLIWSSRKLSATTPSALTYIELFIVGYGLFITVGGALSVVKPVMTKMYEAARSANMIPTLFLGEILYNPGVLYFPIMWFVWSTPLTFPLMGFALYRAWQQRKQAEKAFRITVVFGLFILFYLLGLSLVAKKISRYIVIFLPVVSLLMALGAVQIAQLFKKKQLRYLFLIAVAVLQVAPVLRLHPYYRTYYYPLLSGKWVSENTSSITGAGLDLAADYLNTLPNAQHLRVRLSSLFSNDLAYYFVGHTGRKDLVKDPHRDFDYDVEYLYDKQIYGTPIDPPPIDDIQLTAWQLSQELPRALEHVVRLNGIDYVWIYRVLPEETP